jgi:hypothetical protein
VRAQLDPSDLLKTEFLSVPVAEILGRPVGVLLGVSDDAETALGALGIESVFDLALSRVFAAAVELEDAGDDATNTFSRFGSPPADLVKPGVAGATRVSDLRFESVEILAGIPDPAALQSALGVVTVRDLAVYPPFRAATTLLQSAFFPEEGVSFDPEAPADLVPKSGEYTTERVQYSTLVLDRILRPDGAPPLIDVASAEFGPVDAAPVADPDFGFQTLGLGALLTFNQSWFMQGVTLGHLLHSMALAPGESTRLAVVDWSRKTSAGQTEVVGETEDLTQDTSRNRSISEVTQAVAREAQTGFSHTESESTTKQAGASGGFSIGPVGFGGSASIAKTTTSADSYATTAGSREVGASMLQQASDRTHQHAHASRTRRASVVREVSQSEHEQVSTRVITNYNHMHAMTVQYYEVLQVYRTETALVGCDRVVFVPFKLIDFANEDVLRRFRAALVEAALTATVRDALLNYDTLELVPDRRVRFPGLGGTLEEAVLDVGLPRRTMLLARRAGETGETGEPGETPEVPERPERPEPEVPDVPEVSKVLWGGVGRRLSSILGSASLRRGSESLFVPSDVRIVDGAVRSAAGDAVTLRYHRADGSAITDLTLSVPLAEIARVTLAGSSATAAVEATATLTLARNGVVFPIELPTVTVDRGSAETPLIRIEAASADVNLVEHLAENRLHYSQAVFRALDAAMIAGLLSPFSIELNGETFPLVQVAEPIPLRIVGNALAFKINTDPVNDEEWRGFMRDRGLEIGEAKVDLVPLSSGGIFAEAVLGRFNSAEKLDLTRFWNWQDSPIPIQPSEIAAIQTGTRATPEDLEAGPLSQPLVSITPPSALPDPTGMAGVLAAIQSGTMFRDMSGLSETVKLASEAIKASSAGATAVGAQASKNMEVAVTADTERQRIAADLLKALAGKSLGDKSESAKGAAVNEVDKRKAAEGAAGGSTGGEAGTAGGGGSTSSGTPGTGGGSSGGGGTGGTSGGGGGTSATARPAPASTGNVALDRIVGNDDLVRRFIGMSEGSPVPTPALTAEGVPLLEWDIYGLAYSLMFRATGATEADFPSEAQIEQMVTAKRWKPTDPRDFEPLLLGDEHRIANTFGSIILPLSLMPAGSLQTLNIVAHATRTNRLAFQATFTFDEALGEFDIDDDDETFPLSSLDFTELLALTGDAPIEVQGGAKVRLADVRRAFPVDGEIRVFNLSNPLEHEFVQALANFFQVRTTAFVDRPVRVLAEVIAVTDPASERVLAKQVDIGFLGDDEGTKVDFFTHLLGLDRSVTGAFTAFPRR